MARFGICGCVGAALLLGWLDGASAQQPEAEVEHLIKAAAHLEQAGLSQMAADVRQLVAAHEEQLKQRLLDARRQEIAELQAEIDQLTLTIDPQITGPKIVLHLKALRLSMEKLRQFGLDLVSIRQLVNPESPPSLVDDSGEIVQFLQLLETQGLADILAQLTLETHDGRPVRTRLGSASSADTDTRPSGRIAGQTPHRASPIPMLACTPTLTSGCKVRLELTFASGTAGRQHGALEPLDVSAGSNQEEHKSRPLDGQPTDGSRRPTSNGIRTEVGLGQTLILATQESNTVSGAARTTVVLIEPEVVQP
jgi:hypothetical protein